MLKTVVVWDEPDLCQPNAADFTRRMDMKTILVVDDEPIVRHLVTTALSAKDYVVLSATDGQTGLELARARLPDLIISDIGMPVMDGYGMLTALQTEEATAAIPFIFLSGKEDRQDIRLGMNLGADDYLTKPFTLQELYAAVSTRLEKRDKIVRRSEKKLDDLCQNIAQSLPHELRTPLTIVRGYSNLLIDDFQQTDPNQAQMLEAISTSAERLYQLTERFWTYTEAELARINPHWSQSLAESKTENPKGVIEQVGRLAAQENHRAADVVFGLVNVTVRIDEEHLRKIVFELVSNAAKFSAPGTPIYITAFPDSYTYQLQVSDRGRGMTSEQITSIGAYMQFERRRYEQQGTGLGLAIVKRLAEAYNGQLVIDSVLGQKTSVSVTLQRG
ncbi:MAG: hybrid sensor histidine kinase/response regulator [Anaerolineae bacterium]|nr:hybrid sensor histidine kinase/response regulator [Anaerolineae bacterium]